MELVTIEFVLLRSDVVLIEITLRKQLLYSGDGMILCGVIAAALSEINGGEVVSVRKI